jgi:Fe-S cluster biosynthesis and repair protein YggX
MDINQKIAQFETMVRPEADPNNDMAWFSLGGAYAQAGRHADAANAYLRCVELNPGMSKGWQLAGRALIDAGDKDRAADILTRGYAESGKRGDRMPRQAMGDMLVSLGKTLPAEERPAATGAGGTDGFVCHRTGKPGTKLARPPFKGPVGKWIFENISTETWEDWIRQGTKVINEMRLDLSRDEHGELYDQQMREYLGIDEELLQKLRAGG